MSGMFVYGIDAEAFAVESSTGTALPAAFALGIQRGEEFRAKVMDGAEHAIDYYPDGAAIEWGGIEPFEPTDSGIASAAHKFGIGIRDAAQFIDIVSGTVLSAAPRMAFSNTYIGILDKGWGDSASMQVFGCRRDMCVYPSRGVEQRPNPRSTPFRTTGFHYHVGLPEELKHDALFLSTAVVLADHILGTASVIADSSGGAQLRRKLYGPAGTYRLPPWGLEYRTAQSSAVMQTENVFVLQTELFTQAMEQFGVIWTQKGIDGFRDMFGDFSDWDALAACINDADVDVCNDMHEFTCKQFGLQASGQALRNSYKALQDSQDFYAVKW